MSAAGGSDETKVPGSGSRLDVYSSCQRKLRHCCGISMSLVYVSPRKLYSMGSFALNREQQGVAE